MGDRNINCQQKCEAEQERENEAVQEKGLHAYVWESKLNCLFTPSLLVNGKHSQRPCTLLLGRSEPLAQPFLSQRYTIAS